MQTFLTVEFRKELAKIVAEIESSSEVEIVVGIKPISSFYYELYLVSGILTSFLVFTFFMFYDHVFGDYLIYMGTIFSFFFGITLGFILKDVFKFFIPKKLLQRNVEIMARALFQKGGIHHTKEKVGVFILFSIFEKKHFIVADRKAQNSIPFEEWKKINSNFEKVFNNKESSKILTEELIKTKDLFSKFLPPIENDINELADDLEINL